MKNNQQQPKVSCHYRVKQQTLDNLTYHSLEDTRHWSIMSRDLQVHAELKS